MKYTITAYFEWEHPHQVEEICALYAYEPGCIDATKLSGIVNDHIRYAIRVKYEFSDKDQATDCFNEFRDGDLEKTHARLYADEELVDSFGDMSLFRGLSERWTFVEILRGA